jgi:Uma2 family endonuclease
LDSGWDVPFKRHNRRSTEGANQFAAEVIITPDLLVEVVSTDFEEKDTEWLLTAYWEAGVREYWVVDGRNEPVSFVIYGRGPRGFIPTRKIEGWCKSRVLDHMFRFVPGGKKMGFNTYSLEVS